MATTNGPTGTGLVRRASELAPPIREKARQIESDRRLDEELIERMADTGLFKLRVPVRYGGYEADMRTLASVITELGAGDGLVAWTTSVSSICSWLVGLFPDEMQDEVFDVPAARVLPMPALLAEQYASKINSESAVYRAPLLPTACMSVVGTAIGLARAARANPFERRPQRKITYTAYARQSDAPITHLQVDETPMRRIQRDIQVINLHANLHPDTNHELYGRILGGSLAGLLAARMLASGSARRRAQAAARHHRSGRHPDGSRVTRALVQAHDGEPEAFEADLVIDTTRTRLADAGVPRGPRYDRPEEERTKIWLACTTRHVNMEHDPFGSDLAIVLAPTPQPHRGAFTYRVPGKGITDVPGRHARRPPADRPRRFPRVREVAAGSPNLRGHPGTPSRSTIRYVPFPHQRTAALRADRPLRQHVHPGGRSDRSAPGADAATNCSAGAALPM